MLVNCYYFYRYSDGNKMWFDKTVEETNRDLFIHSAISGIADFEEFDNTLSIRFNDPKHLEFHCTVMIDLMNRKVISVSGRHESAYTFTKKHPNDEFCDQITKIAPFSPGPKGTFQATLSNDYKLHVFDTNPSCSDFVIDCNLKSFFEIYEKQIKE